MPIDTVRQTISVFVDHFPDLPAWKVAETIRRCLSDNFGAYAVTLNCALQPREQLSVRACATFTLIRAAVAISHTANASYGVSVVPYNVRSRSTGKFRQVGLYMAVRNRWELELLFFGAKKDSPKTVRMLGDAAFRALSGRCALPNAPEAEGDRIARLSAVLTAGIDLIFQKPRQGWRM